jgi:cell division protein FtsZ
MTYMRLVEQAFENPDSISIDRIAPKIVVIGCGGGGCNSVHRLRSIGLTGVETVAINTDRAHLAGVKADKKILVGEHVTKGFGTGGDPVVGEKCARDSIDIIKRALEGADLAFIVAGMGGGSGTGIAPVVAEAAKDAGILSVAIVTTPFTYERGRLEVSRRGIEKLSDEANCTVVLDNNKLLTIAPKLPVDKAFCVMDQVVAETVKGLSEMLFETSMINLDFSDFTNVMSQGGMGTVMFGESEDVEELVCEALGNPFLEVDFSRASGALIQITGGADLTLKDAYGVFQGIIDKIPAARNVKFGAKINEDDHTKMKRVMGIVTGVTNQNRQIVRKLAGWSAENMLTRLPPKAEATG